MAYPRADVRFWRLSGNLARRAVVAVILALAAGGPGMVAAQEPRHRLAIADFSFLDTSGEIGPGSDHGDRRESFAKTLREALESTGRFALVDVACPAEQCPVIDGVASEALVAAARRQGARYLVVGGVQKTSTLVQWARLGLLDLEAGRIVVDRLYTFRGDTLDAWRHAALYVARHVKEAPITQ